jgi:hypothetical protein
MEPMEAMLEWLMVSHSTFRSAKCSSKSGDSASPKLGCSRHQYALIGLVVVEGRFIGIQNRDKKRPTEDLLLSVIFETYADGNAKHFASCKAENVVNEEENYKQNFSGLHLINAPNIDWRREI